MILDIAQFILAVFSVLIAIHEMVEYEKTKSFKALFWSALFTGLIILWVVDLSDYDHHTHPDPVPVQLAP